MTEARGVIPLKMIRLGPFPFKLWSRNQRAFQNSFLPNPFESHKEDWTRACQGRWQTIAESPQQETPTTEDSSQPKVDKTGVASREQSRSPARADGSSTDAKASSPLSDRKCGQTVSSCRCWWCFSSQLVWGRWWRQRRLCIQSNQSSHCSGGRAIQDWCGWSQIPRCTFTGRGIPAHSQACWPFSKLLGPPPKAANPDPPPTFEGWLKTAGKQTTYANGVLLQALAERLGSVLIIWRKTATSWERYAVAGRFGSNGLASKARMVTSSIFVWRMSITLCWESRQRVRFPRHG